MVLIELLVFVLFACVALAWLARRAQLPYPIALVLGGATLSFFPGLPQFPFDPNLILVIVLPPVLYLAALTTSWRDFKRNARAIGLLAVGLVIATTFAVAAAARVLLPELPWPVAIALGAIVSPPDAVAATAVLARIQLPRQITTILEGESLVNDATGLVLYKFAVAAAVTGVFSLPLALGQFVLVAAGGVLIGMLLGWLFVALHRRLLDPLIEILASLVLPFSAYLLAEAAHVSGVLAVVAAGLVRARHAPEVFSPQSRILAQSMWNVVVFLMNCLVFMLIGLQLSHIVRDLALGYPMTSLLGIALILTLVTMAARMAWVFPGTYLPRWIERKLGRRPVMPPWQQVSIVGWCGMRGIVSLAAALALPLSTAGGAPFPGRDLVIFLAFAIILLSLVVPGVTLAPLVRWLKVGGDWDAHDEQNAARMATARAGLAEIERLERDRHVDEKTAGALRVEYQARLARASPSGLVLAPGADPFCRAYRAGLAAERRALIALWRSGKIGDEVLHRIERELDYAEARLD